MPKLGNQEEGLLSLPPPQAPSGWGWVRGQGLQPWAPTVSQPLIKENPLQRTKRMGPSTCPLSQTSPGAQEMTGHSPY